MGRPHRHAVVVAVLASAACVLGIAIVALVVVATTPFGARQALRLAADRIPGELAIRDIDGSLYSGLVLRGVRYRNETIDANLGSLSVEPSVRDLATGRLVVDRIRAADGRIEIADAADGAAGAPPERTDAADTPERADAADAAERAGTVPTQSSAAGASALPRLPAGLEVRDLRIEDVQIDGLGPPLRIETLTGSISDGSIELDRIEIDGAGATLVASGDAMLAADRATGTLAGSVRLPSDEGGADADDAASAAPGEVVAFETTFAVDEGPGDSAWRASIDWSRVEWRRPEAPSLASPGGTLVVRPRDDGGFDVALRTSVEGERLPGPASLTASAAVSTTVIDVERARIEVAGAEAVAAGAFGLDALSGYASVDYRGIDPSRLDARLSGDLRGAADLAIAAKPTLRIAGSGLIGGELDGRPLDGRIVASYADAALSIERADVELDDGRVAVVGMLSPETADLRFSAALPRVGNWYPPVTGSLTAEGSIAGDTDDPRVELDVEGTDLVLVTAPPLEHVSLRVDGTRAMHALRLDAASTVGRVALEAEQHYADGTIDGRLLTSMLAPRNTGVWRLTEPTGYGVAGAEIALEPACYAGPEDARVCAAVAGDTLTVNARAVPNALAEPWLPEGFDIGGTTSADAEVALAGPRVASVTLRHQDVTIGVESDAAAASLAVGDAAEETRAAADERRPRASGDVVPLLDLDDVTLRATLDPSALRIELIAAERAPAAATPALLAPTALAGRLTLSPPRADGRVDGFVSARLTELAPIGTLVDGVDDLSGIIDARVALSGTARAPSFSGRISGSELAAELAPLGIGVADGSFSAEVADLESVPFDAEVCSDGCARMSGRLSLPREGDWALTADLRGERLLLVDLPDVRAVATPRLELRATPERAAVTGTLAIPQGSVEIEDVPRSAVRPASETVVHGRETPEDDEAALPVPLVIDLQTSLGDVRFDGLGLEAQLDGTLDVERTAAGDWVARGTTTIEEGTFTAYGQTLTIEQGLLVFTGPPDNPALDIRATRVVDDAEVGLTITGTAENPRSEVFSEAGLAESEAFAQLLTGRSLDDLGQSDPEALERAAIGLGLRRALPTLGRIGAALGLDELGIQAPGETRGAVVAGRQIGDDLYLRYRHGLFDDFSGLELIYRITEHFRLRTETGTAQSIDLIYEMDPDPDTLSEDVEEIDVAIGDREESSSELPGPDVDAE